MTAARRQTRTKPKAAPEPNKEATPEAEPPKEKSSKTKKSGKATSKLDTTLAPAVEDKENMRTEASPVDEDNKERARFSAVRAKAMQDKNVGALKEKAEAAQSDEELKKASKEYYKALYKRMRALDDSLKDRIDRMESAMMRRLDASGAKDEQ